jgi:hypothetical protein
MKGTARGQRRQSMQIEQGNERHRKEQRQQQSDSAEAVCRGTELRDPPEKRIPAHAPTAVTVCQCRVSDLVLGSCSSPIAWKLDRGPGMVGALPHVVAWSELRICELEHFQMLFCMRWAQMASFCFSLDAWQGVMRFPGIRAMRMC